MVQIAQVKPRLAKNRLEVFSVGLTLFGGRFLSCSLLLSRRLNNGTLAKNEPAALIFCDCLFKLNQLKALFFANGETNFGQLSQFVEFFLKRSSFSLIFLGGFPCELLLEFLNSLEVHLIHHFNAGFLLDVLASAIVLRLFVQRFPLLQSFSLSFLLFGLQFLLTLEFFRSRFFLFGTFTLCRWGFSLGLFLFGLSSLFFGQLASENFGVLNFHATSLHFICKHVF